MARALTYLYQQQARASVGKHVTFNSDFSFFTSLILKKISEATEAFSELCMLEPVCMRASLKEADTACHVDLFVGIFYSTVYVRTSLRSIKCIC